jgi:hypothetical protein
VLEKGGSQRSPSAHFSPLAQLIYQHQSIWASVFQYIPDIAKIYGKMK